MLWVVSWFWNGLRDGPNLETTGCRDQYFGWFHDIREGLCPSWPGKIMKPAGCLWLSGCQPTWPTSRWFGVRLWQINSVQVETIVPWEVLCKWNYLGTPTNWFESHWCPCSNRTWSMGIDYRGTVKQENFDCHATILNQKGKIWSGLCGDWSKESTVRTQVETLRKYGAMDYTIVVTASGFSNRLHCFYLAIPIVGVGRRVHV